MNELSVLRSITRDPAVLTASLVSNLLALAIPLAMLQIYDRVIPNQAHETLIVLVVIVAGALAVDSVLRVARSRLLAFFAAQFEQIAYRRAIWALIMEDPSQYQRVDSGTLNHRMSAIDRLRSQRADGAAAALLDLPFALVFLSIMAWLSPVVAGAIALMLGLACVVLRYLRQEVNAVRHARFKIEARRHSFLSEVLEGIKSVKSLQIADLVRRRQERLLGRSAQQTMDLTSRVHQAQGLATAIGSLTPVVTAATAGFLVISGEASIGVLAAVVVLSGRIVQPVLRVEGYLSSLDSVRQAEADLTSLTNTPLRQSGDLSLTRVDTLEIRAATFCADPDFGIVMEDLDIRLKTGDCLLLRSDDPLQIAVAARMFMGELALARGEILVNDYALDAYRLRDRQDRIRLLPKEAQLLEGTLFENICAFQPVENRENALDLADDLGLQKVLKHSPRGLQTPVLSVMDPLPQSVQRIACNISALVTLPDVVIFQAANTGLDQEADQSMLDWLKKRAPHHILILATNRPSYMALATKTLDLKSDARPWLQEV